MDVLSVTVSEVRERGHRWRETQEKGRPAEMIAQEQKEHKVKVPRGVRCLLGRCCFFHDELKHQTYNYSSLFPGVWCIFTTVTNILNSLEVDCHSRVLQGPNKLYCISTFTLPILYWHQGQWTEVRLNYKYETQQPWSACQRWVCKAVTQPDQPLPTFPSAIKMNKLEINQPEKPSAWHWMRRDEFQCDARGYFNTLLSKKKKRTYDLPLTEL